jgi:hypothetical protein
VEDAGRVRVISRNLAAIIHTYGFRVIPQRKAQGG